MNDEIATPAHAITDLPGLEQWMLKNCYDTLRETAETMAAKPAGAWLRESLDSAQKAALRLSKSLPHVDSPPLPSEIIDPKEFRTMLRAWLRHAKGKASLSEVSALNSDGSNRQK